MILNEDQLNALMNLMFKKIVPNKIVMNLNVNKTYHQC